jgi:hypothetical protein
MAIYETNYEIVQGDTWEITVPVTDLSGAPVTNLTGYTFDVQVRDKEGGHILCAEATLGNGVTASSGNIIVSFTPDQTSNFNLPKSVYQIQAIYPNLKRKTLQVGWIQVHPAIIQ